jgi:hypothetical protein
MTHPWEGPDYSDEIQGVRRAAWVSLSASVAELADMRIDEKRRARAWRKAIANRDAHGLHGPDVIPLAVVLPQ